MQQINKTMLYDSYLSEHTSDIANMINTPGKCLTTAPTGAGKTYAITKSFDKLTDSINILLVPNRSQGIQVSKDSQKSKEKKEIERDMFCVVGGVSVDHIRPYTMNFVAVYDKAKTLKEYALRYPNKAINLVIDEAHQIIDSSNYRKKALEDIQDLIQVSTHINYMTATPRKLIELFEQTNVYFNSYSFVPNSINNNIKNHYLVRLPNEDIITHLTGFIKNVYKLDSKKTLVFLNSKDDIKQIKAVLELQDIKVAVLSSETKEDEVFKEIESNSMLSSEYDVFLATSVLSCGTNIQNEDLNLITAITNKNYFDLDYIAQSTARPRKKIENAYTLVFGDVKKEPGKKKAKIRSKQSITKEWKYKINKRFKEAKEFFNYTLNFNGVLSKNDIITLFKDNVFKSRQGEERYDYNCIEIDDIGNITINQAKLTNKIFKEIDKQYYELDKELHQVIKQNIKADNFIMSIGKSTADKHLKGLLVLEKEKMKLNKIDTRKESIEILKLMDQYQQLDYLLEYLDTGEYVSTAKEINDRIKKILLDKTLAVDLKILLSCDVSSKRAIELLETYSHSKVLNIRDCFTYKQLNRSKYINTNNKTDFYHLTRKMFDETLHKRGRITKQLLFDYNETLVHHKIFKYIDLKENDITLPKRRVNKLLESIQMIYNLTSNKKSYLINSLKK